MAREPDNLVLQMLRDIRAKLDELDEHTRMHQEHRQSFAELRDAMSGANNNAAYAAGFALLSRRDNEATAERVVALEKRVRVVEERLDG